MKYNKPETLNHTISVANPQCISDFNLMIFKEDDSLMSSPTIIVGVDILDLDCVEIRNAQRERRNRVRTMDCTYAISDAATVEMLLVEFRFNYVNMANLSRSVLLEKVIGSLGVLGNSVKINSNYIFIFKSNLVQQAINRLQRMNPRIPNNYVAMDLNTLLLTYF